MNGDDHLRQALLDLHSVLGPNFPLIVAGGYGLFLRQNEIHQAQTQTLISAEALPENRTTEDIDLFLTAEIVVSAERMEQFRKALDELGFQAIPGNEFLQFQRAVQPAGNIKIDLLVGPLGNHFNSQTVKRDSRRIRPKAFSGLHAHPVDEAVGIEELLTPVEIAGTTSNGNAHTAVVHIAQPFTYLLMKLLAFRDRMDDAAKDVGRHHALDIYRVIGLITHEQDSSVTSSAETHREHPKVREARAVVASHFSSLDSIGILRMREHRLATSSLKIQSFMDELTRLLPPLPA